MEKKLTETYEEFQDLTEDQQNVVLFYANQFYVNFRKRNPNARYKLGHKSCVELAMKLIAYIGN